MKGKSGAAALFSFLPGLSEQPEVMPPSDEPVDFYTEDAAAFQSEFADRLTAEEYEIFENYTRFTGRTFADFYLEARSSLAKSAVDSLEQPARGNGDIEEYSRKVEEAIATYELLCGFAPEGNGTLYSEVFVDRVAAESFMKLERHALGLVLDIVAPIYDEMRDSRQIDSRPEKEEFAPARRPVIDGKKLLAFVDSYHRKTLAENYPGLLLGPGSPQ